MKHSTIIMTAAAISSIGIATAGMAASINTPNAPATEPSAALIANHAKAAPADKIDKVFRNLTNDAVTSGDMSKLVSLFDQHARQRISQSSTYSQGYGAQADAQIKQLNSVWKQKYGQDFDVKSHDTFGAAFATIQEATPGHDAKLDAQVNKAAQMNASTMTFKGDDAIALAKVAGGNGYSSLAVPLVCQKGDWKIEVPNTLTAERLRQNLTQALSDINQHSAQLPKNETDAYRQVAHHVLAAVMDNSMPPHAQASAIGAQPTARATPVSTTTSHWWQFWRW